MTSLYVSSSQDPWLRNEVWRFDRRQPDMADRPVLIRRLLTRGLVPGFSLAVVTAGAGVTRDSNGISKLRFEARA